MKKILIFAAILSIASFSFARAQTPPDTSGTAPQDSVALQTPTTGSGSMIELDDMEGQNDFVQDTVPRIYVLNHLITNNIYRNFIFFNVSYFYKLNNRHIIGGGLQIPTFYFQFALGGGISAEYRYYKDRASFDGLYVAGNGSFNYMEYDGTPYPCYSLGGAVAYDFRLWNQLLLDFGLGVDFLGQIREDEREFMKRRKGFVPELRFSVGWAWE